MGRDWTLELWITIVFPVSREYAIVVVKGSETKGVGRERN